MRLAIEGEKVKLRRLFMQASIPVSVVSGPQLVFAFANPLFEQLLGSRQGLEPLDPLVADRVGRLV